MSQVQQTEKPQEEKVSVQMTKEEQGIWNAMKNTINKKLAVKKAKSGGGTSREKGSEELKTLKTHMKNVDKLVQKTNKIEDPVLKQNTIDTALGALRKKMSRVSEKSDKEIDYISVVALLKASAEVASYLPKPVPAKKKTESSESQSPPS